MTDSLFFTRHLLDQPRILMVDDDHLGTEVRAATMRLSGLCVDVANSGDEAVRKAASRHYDIFLVDYDMPKMNGLELSIELRRHGHYEPIIMLSGRLDLPDEPGAELLSEFISKGQGPEALLHTLTRLTSQCRAVTTSQK
jgi:two-component system aerobic respiration control sensor histidine kinase ArcB